MSTRPSGCSPLIGASSKSTCSWKVGTTQTRSDGLWLILPTELRVEEPAVRKEVIRRTLAGFQAMLTAFSLLAVLAGFVICYSRLGSIFESRTWEMDSCAPLDSAARLSLSSF
jgi:hypothetical protein